tara:strand:- start:39 stop:632 length:594 start_codon:yes stop_codon:yes gene_type:complete
MKKFWQKVLLLPYKSNSQDNPLHENQVRELLEEDYVIITKQEFEDEYDADYDKLPVGYGVYQPNGDQQSPDFRVKHEEGETQDIECKSSKQTFPTYNGGLPKKGVIYIFCTKKYNETTIYFAEDVVSDADREWLDETVVLLNELLTEQQKKKPIDEFNRGFDFYIRNMYTQAGRGKKDYFKHSQRKSCESNVLNYNW